MGADVAVLDRNPEALRGVEAVLGNRVRTLFSTCDVVELLCPRADLVIATVLVPGSTTPKLITAQTVKAVKTGAMASFGTILKGPSMADRFFAGFRTLPRRACPWAASG
jgi:alanine dehydrogenase